MLQPDILIGVIKQHGHLALVMNLKKYSYCDAILLQWPTCPRWLPPVLQYTLLFCTGFFFIAKVELYKISLFILSVIGFSC